MLRISREKKIKRKRKKKREKHETHKLLGTTIAATAGCFQLYSTVYLTRHDSYGDRFKN